MSKQAAQQFWWIGLVGQRTLLGDAFFLRGKALRS